MFLILSEMLSELQIQVIQLIVVFVFIVTLDVLLLITLKRIFPKVTLIVLSVVLLVLGLFDLTYAFYLVALINLILSFMLAIIAGTTINNYIGKNINIYLSIVNVGLRQLLLLILIAFGVAFISSFIPVFRLSRKKPIDAIRMR
jgi:ABC-type lipoprotein release transport system permease subunit